MPIMPITTPCDIPLAPMDVTIDDVGSGAPRITIDARAAYGIGPVTFRLLPDTCAMLVDALSGVAPPEPGMVRIVTRMTVADFARAITSSASKEP